MESAKNNNNNNNNKIENTISNKTMKHNTREYIYIYIYIYKYRWE